MIHWGNPCQFTNNFIFFTPPKDTLNPNSWTDIHVNCNLTGGGAIQPQGGYSIIQSQCFVLEKK